MLWIDWALGAAFLLVVLRLVWLQIVTAGFYDAIAEHQHGLYEDLIPRRGRIFVRDHADSTEYPVATLAPKGVVYAVPQEIQDPQGTAAAVAGALGWDPADTERWAQLTERLSKANDPYEPVDRNVDDGKLTLLDTLKLPGIYYVLEDGRAYPEPGFGGQVLGFLGKGEDGKVKGFYGLEGYFNDFLSGTPGKLIGMRDVSGGLIGVGQRSLTPATDGGDLLLTIDRTLQVVACDMLKRGVQKYAADSGALVILEPKTGKVLAMCGVPDFLPGDYANVDDFQVYNNPTIFTPYEPGSIFKPMTVAAGIDAGAITPHSLFNDVGSVQVDDHTIKNAADHVYGTIDMAGALENSVNTAMVWVMRQTGKDTFTKYVHAFGFGDLTGIELNTEVSGSVSALDKQAEVYAATASFGQGITTTPLQMAVAYAALANDGLLMKPYIVDEERYADGTVELTQPTAVRQAVAPATAKQVAALLVGVVEEGHGKRAGVPGYYIAGKTGTAQIAENGAYSATKFNGSFAGFGPVADPAFVMVVQITNPKTGVIYAESTAAPVFGEIAAFLLQYFGIPPERVIE